MHHAALVMKSVDTAARAVDCLASTNAIDSYDEIVDQSWKLERFLRNPVVLFAHNSRTLPIGRAENVRVTSRGLEARIVFASGAANPEAEKVFQLVKEKILTGISVGFAPGRFAAEKRGGKDVTVLYDNELWELSIVPIPANPEAMIKAKAAGLIGASVVTREYVEWLEGLPGDTRLSARDEELIERRAGAFESADALMGNRPVPMPAAALLTPEMEAEIALTASGKLPGGESNASLRAAMIGVEARRLRGERPADEDLASRTLNLVYGEGSGDVILERQATRRSSPSVDHCSVDAELSALAMKGVA